MPKIHMPKRSKGQRIIRGRPITSGEYEKWSKWFRRSGPTMRLLGSTTCKGIGFPGCVWRNRSSCPGTRTLRSPSTSLAQYPEGLPDRVQVPRGTAVLHVVPLGEVPIGRTELDYEHLVRGGADDRGGRVGGQFADQAGIAFLGLGRAVGAEVVVLAPDDNSGLTRGLVELVGGDVICGLRHGVPFRSGKVVGLPLFPTVTGRASDRQKVS